MIEQRGKGTHRSSFLINSSKRNAEVKRTEQIIFGVIPASPHKDNHCGMREGKTSFISLILMKKQQLLVDTFRQML